jgi:hypothetical protein
MIYAVELPGWIPSNIVNQMNEHFQNSLRQEIEMMLQEAEQDVGPNIRQKHHATHMSESNISVASTTNFFPRHEKFVRLAN